MWPPGQPTEKCRFNPATTSYVRLTLKLPSGRPRARIVRKVAAYPPARTSARRWKPDGEIRPLTKLKHHPERWR